MARGRLVLQERKRDKKMQPASGVKDDSYLTQSILRGIVCRRGDNPERACSGHTVRKWQGSLSNGCFKGK